MMKMLKEKIKNDPYLKIGNCVDESDLRYALNRINELRNEYPDSKLLENMYFRFEYKRMKIACRNVN